MSDIALFLLLLVAIGCGWLLGNYQARGAGSGSKKPTFSRLSNDEQIAASVLVHELPDHALDSFLAALDVNSDTLETHLALGAAWRKKGEIERAIRIHQHLLERKGLKAVQRELVQYELAIDYVRAGLIDRAEGELQNLVEHSRGYRKAALFQLLDLYQQSSEWRKAINVANLIVDTAGTPPLRDKMNRLRGHFYCELAGEALEEQDYLGVRRALGRAMQFGPALSRPQVLLAELELALERRFAAVEIINRLVDERQVMPPVLRDLLPQYHESLCDEESVTAYGQVLLRLYRRFGEHWVAELILDMMQKNSGSSAVRQFIGTEIQQRPRPGLIGEAIARSIYTPGDQQVREAVVRLLQARQQVSQKFVCGDCGFSANQWHWQCPGCKHWDSLSVSSSNDMNRGFHA